MAAEVLAAVAVSVAERKWREGGVRRIAVQGEAQSRNGNFISLLQLFYTDIPTLYTTQSLVQKMVHGRKPLKILVFFIIDHVPFFFSKQWTFKKIEYINKLRLY